MSHFGSHLALTMVNRDFDDGDYEALLALDDQGGRLDGATPGQIHRLPSFCIDNEEDKLVGRTCSICLEKYEVGQKLRTLPCLHNFHAECVDNWLGRKANCPVCKFDI